MRKFLKFLFQLTLVAVAFALGMAYFGGDNPASRFLDQFKPTPYEIRMDDLKEVRSALAQYKRANNSYPVSQGWDGLYSKWGASSPEWIKGLVPEFIDELPRDPRKDTDPEHQYLYKSDGKDFKLITHRPDDFNQAKEKHPDLIDPARNTWAWGFWTKEARDW